MSALNKILLSIMFLDLYVTSFISINEYNVLFKDRGDPKIKLKVIYYTKFSYKNN